MIDCMYNKCMYRTFEGEKTECKCFSVKNNGLKRYLEMCYSVSCKKNSIQRPSILYEREKNYSIFSDMQVFVKIRLNIFYNTLHNSHRNNNLKIGVRCIYIIIDTY